MTQTDRKKLSAFEMWVWRRIEKISSVDHVTNDEVLQRVQENRSILDTVQPGLSRGWGRGVSYPGPREVWRAPPSARNL